MKSDELTDVDQQRIKTIVRQFEAACQALDAGYYPRKIAEFLPEPRQTLFLPVLTRLVLSDMRRRGRLGASINLDVYVERFEELRHAAESMPKLMRAELELRRQAGEDISMNGYRKRFPEHFAVFHSICQTLEGTLRLPASKSTSDDRSATIAFHGDTAKRRVPKQLTPRTKKGQAAAGKQTGQMFVPDVNAYELIRPIGEGQFGKVWQAVAPGGVDVAVKIVSWPRAHRMTQMELRALEAVKRIRHPFLIQMHAYWAMEDQLVMIMELADGNLEQRHKECIAAGEIGIPIDELVKYTCEAAEALDHLHCEQVVHRDIKPANILLVKGHAKLGDFGVARLVELEKPDFRATVVGTPLFMAAEVFDHQVGPASDQYSLAAMYLDLRVGLPEVSLSDLMSGKGSLPDALLKLPEPECRVLKKALDRDPDQRFADCRLLAEALKAATVTQVPPKPTRWGLRLTAAVVLITGVLAGVFSILNDGKGPPNLPAPPVIELPPLPPHVEKFLAGFREAEDFKPVPINNIDYPDHVFRDRDDLALEFVLITPVRQQDPNAFYIMVNKVSNEAFAKFTQSPDGKGPDGKPIGQAWKQYQVYERDVGDPTRQKLIGLSATDHPKLPVMYVSIDEAHSFAKWIHPEARFPTEKEWKKAAGYYDCHEGHHQGSSSGDPCADHPEGPFKGQWKPGLDVAVGCLRPREIGTSRDDISPFGCRDMSGNGYEFINSDLERTFPIKEPEQEYFHLLGMGWDKKKPYAYNTELVTLNYLDDSEQKPNRQRDTGFRIVIPIPRTYSSSPGSPTT